MKLRQTIISILCTFSLSLVSHGMEHPPAHSDIHSSSLGSLTNFEEIGLLGQEPPSLSNTRRIFESYNALIQSNKDAGVKIQALLELGWFFIQRGGGILKLIILKSLLNLNRF